MTPRDALLGTVHPHSLAADTAEDGIATLAAATGLAPDQLRDAIAEALAAGLVREPIRLEPGALHCRWVLELTPSGRAAARRLTGD
jgi:hypothetical protein